MSGRDGRVLLEAFAFAWISLLLAFGIAHMIAWFIG